jgi:hypothetical protein
MSPQPTHDDNRTPAQRAGVRRTVALLVVVAVAAYAMFLYSAMRGGA